MSHSVNSDLDLRLAHLPIVEDAEIYTALVDIHNALDTLLTAIGYRIHTVTSAYTIVDTDGTVLVDASSGAVTATLPSAVGIQGKKFIVKCVDATNIATLDGDGSETIDGAANITLALWEVVTVQSDGANWLIVG
jgi:hypothetical protein